MTDYIPLTLPEAEIPLVSCAEGVDRIYNELLDVCKATYSLTSERYHSLYELHYTFFMRFPNAVYFKFANEWIKEHQSQLLELSFFRRHMIMHLCREESRSFHRFVKSIDGTHSFPFFDWFMMHLEMAELPPPPKPVVSSEQKALMEELRQMADMPPNVHPLPVFKMGVGYYESWQSCSVQKLL